MKIEMMKTELLKPFVTNPRKNQNVDKVAKSIDTYGFQQPIVVDKDLNVIIGHTRLMASEKLKLKQVPVVMADLPEEKVKALRIADNRLNEDSEWDYFLLTQELKDLMGLEFDLKLTGFEQTELDNMLSFDQNEDLKFNDLVDDQDKYSKSLVFVFDELEKYQEIVELLNNYIHRCEDVETNEQALEKLLFSNQGS